MMKVKTLGRRQVVRQLVLVQPFRGSNPFAPVKLFLRLFFQLLMKEENRAVRNRVYTGKTRLHGLKSGRLKLGYPFF